MKQTNTRNQANVETGLYSVNNAPIRHSGKGGSYSLKISRQLMFHPRASLPSFLAGAGQEVWSN